MMARLARIADLVYHVVSSARVAAAVILAWILLLLVWIVPFVFYGIPGSRIQAIINREPFFIVVYVALIISTVACILPRSIRVVRRARRVVGRDTAPRFPSASTVVASAPDLARVANAVRRAGFHQAVIGEGWVWGVRNRWTGLGTLFFHASFLVIACAVGVVAYAGSGFTGEFVLTEGESALVDSDAYITMDGDGAPRQLDVGAVSIEPHFHEDVLLFTRLEATLETPSGLKRVSVGNPWHPDILTNVALTDFGWSLQVTGDASAGTTGTSVYDLKVFPSGTKDRFEINLGRDTYFVDVRVFGDYVDRDGQPGSRSFNADNPRVLISVWRAMSNGEDRLLIDNELLAPGDVVELVDATLRIDGVLTHGVFQVTHDPARAVVLFALFLGLLGTVVRLLFPRTELLIWQSDEQTHVHVRSDVYGRQAPIEARISSIIKRRG